MFLLRCFVASLLPCFLASLNLLAVGSWALVGRCGIVELRSCRAASEDAARHLKLRDSLEDVDDGGVELRAGAALELEQRVARRDGVAEHARARHRVVGV